MFHMNQKLGYLITFPGNPSFIDHLMAILLFIVPLLFLLLLILYISKLSNNTSIKMSSKKGLVEREILLKTTDRIWMVLLIFSSICWTTSELILSNRLYFIRQSTFSTVFFTRYAINFLMGKSLFISLLLGRIIHIWIYNRGLNIPLVAISMPLFIIPTIYFIICVAGHPVKGVSIYYKGKFGYAYWSPSCWFWWEKVTLLLLFPIGTLFIVWNRSLFKGLSYVNHINLMTILFFACLFSTVLASIVEFNNIWLRNTNTVAICLYCLSVCAVPVWCLFKIKEERNKAPSDESEAPLNRVENITPLDFKYKYRKDLYLNNYEHLLEMRYETSCSKAHLCDSNDIFRNEKDDPYQMDDEEVCDRLRKETYSPGFISSRLDLCNSFIFYHSPMEKGVDETRLHGVSLLSNIIEDEESGSDHIKRRLDLFRRNLRRFNNED
eukprot:GHVP01023812.1.p1 GENE.GHVP01023812.1~~GHVP01023812.1.p1  ORF type:complete len:437 (-),score=37.63 GHVP01023812.1:266-1576(-)